MGRVRCPRRRPAGRVPALGQHRSMVRLRALLPLSRPLAGRPRGRYVRVPGRRPPRCAVASLVAGRHAPLDFGCGQQWSCWTGTVRRPTFDGRLRRCGVLNGWRRGECPRLSGPNPGCCVAVQAAEHPTAGGVCPDGRRNASGQRRNGITTTFPRHDRAHPATRTEAPTPRRGRPGRRQRAVAGREDHPRRGACTAFSPPRTREASIESGEAW